MRCVRRSSLCCLVLTPRLVTVAKLQMWMKLHSNLTRHCSSRWLAPTTHHARALVFDFLDGPANIDLIVHIFTQRAMMMRRALIKIPSIAPIVALIFQHYQRLEMFGTYRDDLDHDSLLPAPLPGGKDVELGNGIPLHRAQWGFFLKTPTFLEARCNFLTLSFAASLGPTFICSLILIITCSFHFTILRCALFTLMPNAVGLSYRGALKLMAMCTEKQ